ncbi:SDR family oxidoreductase [Pseudooceanicola sp. CBS1P-1]|uniref:SDR family oxidoreductase n=1 Tax=Pseudooceanicola albus TaxID=2692189 RepID=A0A6L7GBQ5_9RHOB|nr:MULTISPECIES: SDR family NAD(P)-dependent oxidoreductase [Pseudooceanicola]MBT9386784.1 SDR family oxidoreductase [Pseudooceanicola endophyticus]MXN20958.1 SDR family oxidoreductase [Pseudooceanicola albus]
MHYELEGKVALITGGAGGIGAATCRIMAESGARIVVADIATDRAEAVAADLRASGHEAIALTLDLGSEDSIRAMYRATEARYGRLDIVDNNAALLTADQAQRDGDIEHMRTDDWDAAFAVNTRGTMISCREALRLMTPARRGVIINTASNLALQGNVIQAAYSASKAAVIQMTRAIATSHGKLGIRCNAVLPGLTGTPSALAHLPAELRETVEEETLTPGLGAPEDIAHLVAFLASDAARYITGQAMAADGGTSVHVPGYARLNRFFNGVAA